MSYRIEYDTTVGKYEVHRNSSRNISALICMSAVAILLILTVLSPNGLQLLHSVLIPGDDTITVSAFQTMTNDLRCGAGIRDAFFDFCYMVIHGE